MIHCSICREYSDDLWWNITLAWLHGSYVWVYGTAMVCIHHLSISQCWGKLHWEQYHCGTQRILYASMNEGLWWWKANTKAFGSLPAPRSGHTTTIMVFFAHLLILEDPGCHQNLISSSLYQPGPLHKIPLQSIYNLCVVILLTIRQTNRQTTLPKTWPLVCQGGYNMYICCKLLWLFNSLYIIFSWPTIIIIYLQVPLKNLQKGSTSVFSPVQQVI